MRYLLAVFASILCVDLCPSQTEPIEVIPLARTEPVLFEKDIQPIFEKKCLVCHSASVRRGKLDLSRYETVLAGGASGPVLVKGDAKASLLIKLSGRVEKPSMPPKGKNPLTPSELALLTLWVKSGAKQGTPNATVRTHPLPSSVQVVRALAIGADSKLLAVGRANRVHLYSLPEGKLLRTMKAHSSIVDSLGLSPDGKLLASGSYRELALWETTTGKLRKRWTDFADRVTALDFSPDGKLLVVGGGEPTVGGELRVLRTSDLQEVLRKDNAHSDTIFGARFSPDGTKLATGGGDMAVRIFSIPDGKVLKTLQGHSHHVLDVSWEHDGKRLASAGADKKVRLWDYATGEELKKINRGGGKISLIALEHKDQVSRVQFVGKTSQLVTCEGSLAAKLWNLTMTTRPGNYTKNYVQARMLRSFGKADDYLYAVAASPDGKWVASGGEKGVVRIYDAQKGTLVKELPPLRNLNEK